MWQLSYSELYFTDKFWPDFTEEEFEKAIADYQKRERRYGDLAETTREGSVMNKARFISSTTMILVTIAAVLNAWVFITVLLGLTLAGLYEFFYLVKKKGIPIYSYTGIIIGILIPLSIFTRFEPTDKWSCCSSSFFYC